MSAGFRKGVKDVEMAVEEADPGCGDVGRGHRPAALPLLCPAQI